VPTIVVTAARPAAVELAAVEATAVQVTADVTAERVPYDLAVGGSRRIA
jgi:hypothetical protein